MLLELTADQEFFRETTAKFLADQMPIDRLRWLGENRSAPEAAAAEADFWRRGADLGWAALLVSEEAGGGSISGQGVVDLSLIAHEFGRHAAPGPLVPVNLVAAALSDAGAHPGVLAELLAGTAIAAWCHAERAPGDVTLGIRGDGADLVLSGVKRAVEAAAQAKYLLVTGRLAGALTQVLVPADAPGVTIVPLATTDWTRRLAAVTFDEVRVPASAVVGPPGQAGAQVDRLLQLAWVLLAAEAAGAMQAGFDMTVAWAFDRYSFGRPLASYQALKHRFADMKTWLEASHAIADEAAAAVAAGAGGAGTAELARAAKAYTGQYGTELLHECVQMHGGIGLTREHDLHLYLRRVTLNRTLYGTPAEHRRRVADDVIAREGLT